MAERIIDRVVRHLDSIPEPQVEELRQASHEQLANEFVTLRMFVVSLYQEYKDVCRDYAVLHERLDDLQHNSVLQSQMVDNESRSWNDALNEHVRCCHEGKH